LRKQPIAGKGQTKEKKIDDSRNTYLKEGWQFWCCPRFIKNAAIGFVCMTLLD